MSGNYLGKNSGLMFTNPQPIISWGTVDLIKGVVIPRKFYGKISKEEAKEELLRDKNALNKLWGVPLETEYLEPIKTFVWQEIGDVWESFCLSTLITENDKKVYKQAVWFFPVKAMLKLEKL